MFPDGKSLQCLSILAVETPRDAWPACFIKELNFLKFHRLSPAPNLQLSARA